MDIHKSEGLSWADQWDPEPLQPASTDDDKKEGKDGSGKNKSGKKILSLKQEVHYVTVYSQGPNVQRGGDKGGVTGNQLTFLAVTIHRHRTRRNS
ncbi:hypothetical protein RJ639_008577 [Escallonia herrerae]|uniref:Uncharacterized protein n=1 Tax=Escallonia herrerae TaxID=1293975 RepID=A0AA89AQM6_9ASTE|nr:hypothetical protein RJ639_008577 [Escallonia herrerae]